MLIFVNMPNDIAILSLIQKAEANPTLVLLNSFSNTYEEYSKQWYNTKYMAWQLGGTRGKRACFVVVSEKSGLSLLLTVF